MSCEVLKKFQSTVGALIRCKKASFNGLNALTIPAEILSFANLLLFILKLSYLF